MTNEKLNFVKMGSIWVTDQPVTCFEPFAEPTYNVQGYLSLPASKSKPFPWPDFRVIYFASPLKTEFHNVYPKDQLTYDTDLMILKDASYFYRDGKFLCDYRAWGVDVCGRTWSEAGMQRPSKRILKKFSPVIDLLEEKVGRKVIER